MLVLSRNKNESIIINENIVVTVVDVRGDKVRLGIQAPREVPVDRMEVHQAKLQGRELREWQKWAGDGEAIGGDGEGNQHPMKFGVHQADCLAWMKTKPDRIFDLVFCSPPYAAARTYGIDFKLTGQEYVDWCVERYIECLRVCKGLVAWVLEGQTRKFRYSAAPALIMADLHRRGVHLRKPPLYVRHGIPGSGGPDWLQNKYEFVVCATNGGRLPWSDNTCMGHPPVYGPGGAMSNRLSSGTRVNQWGKEGGPRGFGNRRANGTVDRSVRPSHRLQRGNEKGSACSIPVLANPGNLIHCGAVGGGNIGSKLAHENEAPFPESLAEFFIRSFCPPGGVCFDPFCGSGTTLAVAKKFGRHAIGVDVRESQVKLTKRRLKTVQHAI